MVKWHFVKVDETITLKKSIDLTDMCCFSGKSADRYVGSSNSVGDGETGAGGQRWGEAGAIFVWRQRLEKGPMTSRSSAAMMPSAAGGSAHWLAAELPPSLPNWLCPYSRWSSRDASTTWHAICIMQYHVETFMEKVRKQLCRFTVRKPDKSKWKSRFESPVVTDVIRYSLTTLCSAPKLKWTRQ